MKGPLRLVQELCLGDEVLQFNVVAACISGNEINRNSKRLQPFALKQRD